MRSNLVKQLNVIKYNDYNFVDKLCFKRYGGGGGGDKHRIKNYELLVIPSLRLTIEYVKQYKNISEKKVC